MADSQEKNYQQPGKTGEQSGQPQSGQSGQQGTGQHGQTQPGQHSGQATQDPTKKNPSQGARDQDVDDEQDNQQRQRRAS